MKSLLFFFAVLVTVSAARPKEKKSTLEDTERGYVTTKARLSPPPVPKAKSPTQFGFVSVKTAANYAQKEPKIVYAQPQLNPSQKAKNQLYTSVSQYATGAESQHSPSGLQNYFTIPQQYYATPQQYSSETQQYSPEPQEYTQQFSSSSQQYSPSSQEYYTGSQYSSKPQYTTAPQKQTQAYYVPVSQGSQYLNYDNVQFVTDNHIEQQGGQQQNQQYHYLQQYQAPSTSIQAIVDPKGGLQYIMYIPTSVSSQTADQTQNYENIVYANTNNEQYYQQQQQPESQYTTYAEKQPSYEIGKSSYLPKGAYTPRREPKSLLDSYIPSSVQLQYYQQAQQNSIQDTNKYGPFTPAGAESTYRFSYRPSPFKR